MNNYIKKIFFFSCASMALLSCESDDLVTKLEKQSSSIDDPLKAVKGAISYVDGPIYKVEDDLKPTSKAARTAYTGGGTYQTPPGGINIYNAKTEVSPADLDAMGFTDTPDNTLNNFRAVLPYNPGLTRPSNVYINDWSSLPKSDYEKEQFPKPVRCYKQFHGIGTIEPVGPVQPWEVVQQFNQRVDVNYLKTPQLIGGGTIYTMTTATSASWSVAGTVSSLTRIKAEMTFPFTAGIEQEITVSVTASGSGTKTKTYTENFITPKVSCPPGFEVVYTLMSRWKNVHTIFRIPIELTGQITGVWTGSNNPLPGFGIARDYVDAKKFFYTFGAGPGAKVNTFHLYEKAGREFMIRALLRKSNPIPN